MTTDNRRYALNAQLDIQQILLEAQHRWLRPAEICEILQNYRNFSIAPEPPNRPPSGSLFLFDRKVLRYFRKDGHNWRKKRDGKTVKEAHERLKAGSVDVLHCYYAHGEDNESFQRRSYWMLEEELSNIVLVHYREVKGNRTNFSRLRDAASRRPEEDASYSEAGSSGVSRFPSYDYQGASQVTDTASLNSIQASEHEDAESVYRHQASPGLQPVQESQSPTSQTMETGSVPYYSVSTSSGYQGSISTIPIDNGFPYQIQQDHAFQSWENAVEGSNPAYQPVNFQSSFAPAQSSALSTMTGQENELLDQVVTGHFGRGQVVRTDSHISQGWKVSVRDSSNWSAGQNSDGLSLGQSPYYPPLSQPLVNETINPNDANQVDLSSAVSVQNAYITDQTRQLLQDDHQLKELNGVGKSIESYSDGNLSAEDKTNYTPLKQPLLDGVSRESLKKLDSFDRWISKELDDVTNETIQPSSTLYWETVKGEDGDESDISTHVPLDNYILSPSLAQEQLFSIVEFSPNWAYSETEIKVLVVGRFLIRQEEALKCRWACMFGKIEVPAVVVADGVLQCRTPSYENGMIPFYVTCSNRLACSEVREFEFRPIEDADIVDASTITSDETLLHMRFGKLLSLESSTSQTSIRSSTFEITQLCRKINAMLKDDSEWEQMVNLTRQDEFSPDRGKDQLLQKLLKEKLNIWLLQKITEGGKGPSVLDEGGQGVLHFAAALGYDWAIAPTVVAGVNINFRDVNGWTALHWAAYTGRENTVGLLISLGAAPGFVTHPTPKYPSGRTPSDLASSNGHKGIAGYLAESSLSSHLSSITLKDSNRSDQGKAVATVSERTATPVGDGDLPQGLSMKDSLAALRNAHQAAARIHQVYRAQSFQRKQIKEYGDCEVGISDDRALSLLALRNKKAGQHDEPVHAAAVRIQNKFRSWKGRKDFLLIRQRIIKIQAHVRGHQVRKNYRKIILWSVGILDKVILRWRRKGRGLSGFKPEAHATSSSTGTGTQEDEYAYLKEGKKQTEERLQKALARVKSMVQYPDARDQYRRVLNVVQEKKAAYDRILNNPEVDFDDDLFDFSELLDDDTFMPMTS